MLVLPQAWACACNQKDFRNGKIVSPAVWRVREKLRPISGESTGSYLQVATFNMAGCTPFGKPVMSFEKPYKLEDDTIVTGKQGLQIRLQQLSQRYVLTERQSN